MLTVTWTAAATSVWDLSGVSHERLVRLATIACANLSHLDADDQVAILTGIKDMPPSHMHLERVAECALGQDDTAVGMLAYDERVIAAARAILERTDTQPLIDVAGVMEALLDDGNDYRVMQACVELFSDFPLDRISVSAMCDWAASREDDDSPASAFYMAVIALLQRHHLFDDLARYATEPDDDDATPFGACCHEALMAHLQQSGNSGS